MANDVIAERARIGFNRRSTLDRDIIVVNNASGNVEKGTILIESYEAAQYPAFQLSRFRGNVAAPVAVQVDDQLGSYTFYGYTGAAQGRNAAVEAFVDAAVVANQHPATRLEFKTALVNNQARRTAYVSSEGYVGIGTAFDPAVAATRAAHPIHVVASGTGAEYYITAENYGAGADENATFRAGRARGTFAAPTTVVTGDVLGEYEFWGYTNQWHHCAEIVSNVEGVVVAGTTPDSNLFFNTTTGGGIVPRMKIFSSGRIAAGAGQDQTLATNAANGLGAVWIAYNDGSAPLALQRASADTGSPALYFRKSRGTLAAPATVQADDELAYIQGNAYTNAWHDNVGAISLLVDGAVVAGQRPGNRIVFRTGISGAGGPTTRMKIFGAGLVYIGDDPGSPDSNRIFHIYKAAVGFSPAKIEHAAGGASNNVLVLKGGDNVTTGSKILAFNRPDDTEIGSVSQNAAGTVAYNTSSDARLKADVTESPLGLSTLLKIPVRQFRYITDPSNRLMQGFIAQEVHPLYPDAVTVGGESKDCDCEMMEKGIHDADCCHANPWGVDYGRLSPLIIKSIQELTARVSALDGK